MNFRGHRAPLVPVLAVLALAAGSLPASGGADDDRAREALAIARELHPERGFELDGGELVDGAGARISLDNLFRHLGDEPAQRALRRELERILAPIADVPASWDEVRGRIVPLLVPSGFGSEAKLVARPFAGGVSLAYAIDEPTRVRYVSESDLALWKVTAPSVHDAALAWLAAATQELRVEAERPEKRGAPGKYVTLSLEDGFASSRILLPSFRAALAAELGEPFYVAFPNRAFLVAWSRDFAHHVSFLSQVRSDFGERPHAISPDLFLATSREVRKAEGAELLGPSAPE